MEKTLAKLVNFLSENNIDFMITGTAALYLHGLDTEYTPKDIDVKVFYINNTQAKLLRDLQNLCGCKINESYPDKCYTFNIDDTKINAIPCEKKDYTEIVREWRELDKHVYYMPIQKVIYALADKMKLNRQKDTDYMLRLISKLTGLCPRAKYIL